MEALYSIHIRECNLSLYLISYVCLNVSEVTYFSIDVLSHFKIRSKLNALVF
jgi:hypothetical protein